MPVSSETNVFLIFFALVAAATMSISLADIMSEQRLESERDREQAELARALAISLQEAEAPPSTINNNKSGDGDDEDASLALAMQLQAQFEHEDAMRRRAQSAAQSAAWRDPLAKVQVVQQVRLPQRVVRDSQAPRSGDQYYEEDEDDDDGFYDDEDDGEIDEFEHREEQKIGRAHV